MLDWISGSLLKVGSVAPDFGLTDEGGRTVRLFGLRGRPVVLIFYPGDDTLICTQQLCEIRDDWKAFAAGKIAVFGVNGQGIESHGKFSRKHKFPFPLLVDNGWMVSKLYGAGWGVVRRTAYVIGADGRVVYAKRGKPPTTEILAAVEASINTK